jgi:cytochrome c oxidase cbb3-type subunit 2
MSEQKHPFLSHATLERNVGWLIIATIFVVAIAGLVQIVPLFYQHSTTEPSPGVEPYSAIRLAGRDIYQREGCVGCHSQQIRTLRSEVERYGPYSLAGESVYDHPFLWGSKRTGPDLARVGARYSDAWHHVHFINPRSVVPESIMPAYPWLEKNMANQETIKAHMIALRRVGVPYTDEQIANAPKELEGKTEADALIAYLQGLGVNRRYMKIDEMTTK